MKKCENILIECTPKTIFKASFGLKKPPRSSFNTPKKYKNLAIWYLYFSCCKHHHFSIFFLLFFFYFRVSIVYTKSKPSIKTTGLSFKMPLLTSVVCMFKYYFLKGLEDMSQHILHKDQETIRMPVVHVQK